MSRSTDDPAHLSDGLDATARTVRPSAPPRGLWRKGRRRRRTRQVAAGVGAVAAAVALVLPAAALIGTGPEQDASVAERPERDRSGPAIPDTLFPVTDEVPAVRAPGRLAVAYASSPDDGDSALAGVSANDGRTVVLAGVPATSDVGLGGAPRYALSPDGTLLAYARGGQYETGQDGTGQAREAELVIRDLRTGEDLVTDLPSREADRISGLRSLGFSGGVLLVPTDDAPGQSLYAVDPDTGEVTTVASGVDALTFAGAASSQPVLTVGRRVYLGAEPVADRRADHRGPTGLALGPAAVSPDGELLATVETDVQPGLSPDLSTLDVLRPGLPPDIVGARSISGGGAELAAWLADGRIAVRLTRPVDGGGIPIPGQSRWQLIRPSGAVVGTRVMDGSRIEEGSVVVAAGLLGEPFAPGVEPRSPSFVALPLDASWSSVAVLAGGATVLVALSAGVVWARRRRAVR